MTKKGQIVAYPLLYSLLFFVATIWHCVEVQVGQTDPSYFQILNSVLLDQRNGNNRLSSNQKKFILHFFNIQLHSTFEDNKILKSPRLRARTFANSFVLLSLLDDIFNFLMFDQRYSLDRKSRSQSKISTNLILILMFIRDHFMTNGRTNC